MKTLQKSMVVVTLATLLTGIAGTVSAANTSGIKVTGPVGLQNLPSEARNGSILFSGDNEKAMTAKARISAEEAINVATMAHPAAVVETKLDSENGTLIWEVTQQDAQGQEIQLKLDAGNGNLLAAEFGDHEDGALRDHEDSDPDEGHHRSVHEDEHRERDG